MGPKTVNCRKFVNIDAQHKILTICGQIHNRFSFKFGGIHSCMEFMTCEGLTSMLHFPQYVYHSLSNKTTCIVLDLIKLRGAFYGTMISLL